MSSPVPMVVSGQGTLGASLRIEHAARLLRYRQYQDFYEGRHYLRQRNGRTNLVLNYARAIVNKGIAYLLGRGITWSVLPVKAEQARARRRASDVEQLLYEVGWSSDVEAVDLQVAQNAAVLGDGVYKVMWDPLERRVRVLSIDPRTWFPTFAGDDVRTLREVQVGYALRWQDLASPAYGLSERQARALVGGDRTVDVVERWTPTELEVVVRNQTTRRGENPYGFIPFVHVPNLPLANEPWGQSDLVDVIPINRELNERVSDQSDVIRFHADPPVVFKGVTDHSDLPVGPGSVWDIPADADVKLLEWTGQATDVGEHLRRLLSALFEVTETPKTAFGDVDQALTGVALEIQLRPLIQKTLTRRIAWTRGLRRRSELVLALLGQYTDQVRGGVDDYRVRVIWPPMLPKDDVAEVGNQVRLVGAGLRSHRSAMDQLGEESPEEELARVNEDRATLGELGAEGGTAAGGGGDPERAREPRDG